MNIESREVIKMGTRSLNRGEGGEHFWEHRRNWTEATEGSFEIAFGSAEAERGLGSPIINDKYGWIDFFYSTTQVHSKDAH